MKEKTFVILISAVMVLLSLIAYDFNKDLQFTKIYDCNTNSTSSDYRFSIYNVPLLRRKLVERDIIDHTINWASKNFPRGKLANIFIFYDTNFYDKKGIQVINSHSRK